MEGGGGCQESAVCQSSRLHSSWLGTSDFGFSGTVSSEWNLGTDIVQCWDNGEACPALATKTTNHVEYSRDPGDAFKMGVHSYITYPALRLAPVYPGALTYSCAEQEGVLEFSMGSSAGGVGAPHPCKPRHSPATSRRPAKPRLSACAVTARLRRDAHEAIQRSRQP